MGILTFHFYFVIKMFSVLFLINICVLLLWIEYKNFKHSKINVYEHSRDNILNANAIENEILNDFGNVWELFERQAKTNQSFQSQALVSFI